MPGTLSTIKQVLDSQRGRVRQDTRHTKTRGEVSGGGRKPWKQKGTGRARAGSNRSPIWRGGGITFGPQKNSGHKKQINKKMLQLAKKEIFKKLEQEGKLSTYDKHVLTISKTADLASWLIQNQLMGKKVYFILRGRENNLSLSASNIPGIEVIREENIFLPHLIGADMILFPPETATRPMRRVRKNDD